MKAAEKAGAQQKVDGINAHKADTKKRIQDLQALHRAGEYRGGLAMERQIRFRADEAVLQVRSDRRDVPPYGLHGGAAGASSAIRLTRADGSEESPPGKFLTTVRKGDVIRIQLAGGGGYGDPLRRDPARVLRDVCEGKVTIAKASENYGVVIEGAPPQVDVAATQALRRDIRTRSG